MTTQLVFARNGQALTTSEIIAQGVGVQHKNILALVRNYQADFETFGVFAFETRKVENPQGGRPETFAILNEQQATLLVTYCKNTETVRKFKVALVKAFYEMRQQLHPQCPVVRFRHPINREQQNAIIGAINTKAYEACVPKSYVYASLKTFFKVDKYTDIKADEFDLAIGFIQRLNYGNSTKALPAPESPKTLSDNELQAIQRLHRFHADPFWRECAKQAIKVLQAADSRFAGRFYDLIHEPTIAWCTLEKVLDRNHLEHTY
jgi:phage regulator Rha-like protein